MRSDAENKNKGASAKKTENSPKITVKENPRATILKKAPEEALALAIREMMKK